MGGVRGGHDQCAQLTYYLSLIEIDPSLTIYYAAARVGFTPPPNSAGIPQEPEEFLDGQFGGHVRWVRSFAGPNSSVDAVINGVTTSVNRALRFSKIIDSNGNGIPNFFDRYPFDTGSLLLSASAGTGTQFSGGTVAISWPAVPQKIYELQFSDGPRKFTWQPLIGYTNPSTTGSIASILVTNSGPSRFYRLKTMP